MRSEDIALVRAENPMASIASMRLGVDKNLFVPNDRARGEIRRQLGLEHDDLLVLFVGRVDIGKNVPLLLDACQKALAKGARLHLVIVGEGPLSEKAKVVLGGCVTLTGVLPSEKLALFYAASDCLAMVSDVEIGGLVGVEALSCGCPVLASRKNGVAVLCGDTTAVNNIESNVEAWAQALTSLASSVELRCALKQSALAFREEKVASWGQVLCEDFLPLWNGVVWKG